MAELIRISQTLILTEHTQKRIHAKSKLKPSFTYRFRRLLTMPLIGLVILMLDMELAMAGRCICRGSNSAAAPLAGPPALCTQRFSGAFRSRRRQLTQIPINRPALAWGRRSASGRCRPISSRPPCLTRSPARRSLRALRAVRPRTYSTHARSRHRCTHHAARTHCTQHALSLRNPQFISHEWRPSCVRTRS